MLRKHNAVFIKEETEYLAPGHYVTARHYLFTCPVCKEKQNVEIGSREDLKTYCGTCGVHSEFVIDYSKQKVKE